MEFAREILLICHFRLKKQAIYGHIHVHPRVLARKTGSFRSFALRKQAKTDIFAPNSEGTPCFSTVFSTGVEILGEKPKRGTV
jgi:hypothetical protein